MKPQRPQRRPTARGRRRRRRPKGGGCKRRGERHQRRRRPKRRGSGGGRGRNITGGGRRSGRRRAGGGGSRSAERSRFAGGRRRRLAARDGDRREGGVGDDEDDVETDDLESFLFDEERSHSKLSSLCDDEERSRDEWDLPYLSSDESSCGGDRSVCNWPTADGITVDGVSCEECVGDAEGGGDDDVNDDGPPAPDGPPQEAMHQRIAITAERSGFTRSGLAKVLGVSRPTMYGWTNGKFKPCTKNLCGIAVATGVRLEWLAWGQETSGSQMNGKRKRKRETDKASQEGVAIGKVLGETTKAAIGGQQR